jgi:hypothetical protein
MTASRTPGRLRAAFALAMIADLVQIGLWPVFFEGAFSWLNDALDVLVAAAMILLVGWHWAFLPSLLAEVIPTFNLFPTWTAAIAYVARFGGRDAPGIVSTEAAEVAPDGPQRLTSGQGAAGEHPAPR